MNREEALRRYYLNPKICLNCGEIIRVRDVEHPSETRKKKFCLWLCPNHHIMLEKGLISL